ncbi:MAG TPA: hypothetical protein VIV12_31225 [Streptosporangiaceae bacterium]
MRFAFRAFPAASGGALTPRPVVDIALEGLEAAPVECLLDTGALRTRMSAEIASLAGIELPGDLTDEFYVGGVKTVGALARVGLTVTDGTDEFSWDAPVWFCDPWPHPFGLAGLEGFLHHFVVTIHAYDGYLEIEPETRLQDAWQSS